MYIQKYFNPILKTYLNNLQKKTIFPIGNLIGEHKTGIYDFFDENNDEHKPFKGIITYHSELLNYHGALHDSRKIFIENRDLILNNEKIPFEGKLHMDSMNDEGDSCWTCVYYYRIDSGISGGELILPPFTRYTPKEDEIVYFDGDHKHKIGKTFGNGVRGSLIINFKKKS
jgi:hypothetical protein